MAPIHTPFRAPMPSLLQSLRSLTLAPASTTTMSMSRVPSQFCVPARRAFTTTPTIAARKPDKKKLKDPRITLIRYHMQHPKTPRPLRLSRMRALRHWTIHRAWQLARRKKLESQDRELERMHQSIHEAMEALRTLDTPGTKDAGRLYRIALEKKGLFKQGGVPIEYARYQVDTPAKQPWNHGWTR